MRVLLLGCIASLPWRHNGCDGVSNHQPHDCLLNRLFGRRSKKTSKLRVTGLCAGNSPVAGEFSHKMPNNAERVSIWWRHHDLHSPHNCTIFLAYADIIHRRDPWEITGTRSQQRSRIIRSPGTISHPHQWLTSWVSTRHYRILKHF